MAHISKQDVTVRSQISAHLQHLIDSADDTVSPEYIAGLETALAVVTDSADARPKELRNAEA